MTIDQIKAANKAAGYNFFSPDTLRFFGSRILPTVYPGDVFITSESAGFGRNGRVYTVRQFNPAEGWINTVGEFLTYSTRAEAVQAAKAVGR